MVRFRTLALLLMVVEEDAWLALLSQIVTEEVGGAEVVVATARNVPGDVAQDGRW